MLPTHDDRSAIADLTVAYCWAIDGREWEALRNVFLPGATAELGNGLEQGVEAIIDRVKNVLLPIDASHHMVTNHQISVDGERATCRCYLQAQHIRRAAKAGRHYLIAGTYADDLVRTEQGWRIAHRRIAITWREGNPGVLRGDD